VWTPTTAPPPPDAGLPVLFFMTGGGFVIGGVDIPWQLPTSWVERTQSHIVVTINYRLNIFGFPNARGLADGHQNLGFLDQRAALEWVRDNIAAFGGDPHRITMWGQSAGSIAADIQAYAFYQDPIAQAYFMQSGTAFNFLPPKDPSYSNFSFVARQFGCEAPCGDDDDDGAAELDCMRQVPFAQIVNFIGQYGDRGATPPLFFNGMTDNRTMFADYNARSEAGLIARAPVIISTTANEASTMVPWPVQNLTAGPYQPTVTAEGCNVVADPFECGTLVEEAEVLLAVRQPAGFGEAEDGDAVVDGDDDVRLRSLDPRGRQLPRDIDAAEDEAASCHEEEDG
jgi:carboxylesterase type B